LSGERKQSETAPPDFAAVVEDHWDGVFRLLHTLSGDTHETEDLAQDTFLRALDRWGSFKPGTNLRAWLLRIATNAFYDGRRGLKRAKQRIAVLRANAPNCAPPPGSDLETAEQAALARAALEELTELTRTVFHLRVQEDLSFKEIAALVGTTEQAARWHMHQARTKLLKRLEDEGFADEA
jgi:RNA polymerase sigma-70 factor (ECF subfamily)